MIHRADGAGADSAPIVTSVAMWKSAVNALAARGRGRSPDDLVEKLRLLTRNAEPGVLKRCGELPGSGSL